jgi:hypothetical protein
MTPAHNIYTKNRVPNQTHFTEILADKLDWDIICLGNVGYSNFGIADQIKTAIAIKPDLVLFNTTDPERFEIIFDYSKLFEYDYNKFPILKYVHHDYEYLKQIFNHKDIVPMMISCGSGAIESPEYYIQLTGQTNKKQATLLGDKLYAIRDDYKNFLVNSDVLLSTIYDQSLIMSAVYEMLENKVPFICMLDTLQINNQYKFFDDSNHILRHPDIGNSVNLENKEKGYTFATLPHFHTVPQRQIIFANTVIETMHKRNLV